jgi:hypothetical protein
MVAANSYLSLLVSDAEETLCRAAQLAVGTGHEWAVSVALAAVMALRVAVVGAGVVDDLADVAEDDGAVDLGAAAKGVDG